MGPPSENRTDGASIKPVSSLRSHFENMAALEPGAQSPVKVSIPASVSSVDREYRHNTSETRASLDIPRGSSPWSTAGSASDIQHRAKPAPPTPRPRRPGSALSQRPVSMTSATAPRSPPLLAVYSPLKDWWPVGHRTATESSPSSNQALQPRHILPPPPLRSQARNSPATSQRSGGAGIANGYESSRSLQHPDGGPMETTMAVSSLEPISHTTGSALKQSSVPAGRAMPPPVNRAEKPKIPTKPAAIFGKATLEPALPSPKDGVSPFNTPPSSDEDTAPRQEEMRIQAVGKQISVGPIPKEKVAARHSPDPSSLPKPRSETTKCVSQARHQSVDAPDHSFSQISHHQNSFSESRPGLPPRRPPQPESPAQEPPLANGAQNQSRQGLQPQGFRTADPTYTAGPVAADATTSQFLPPPKRTQMPQASPTSRSQTANNPPTSSTSLSTGLRREQDSTETAELGIDNLAKIASEYPDMSNSNRRLPYCSTGVWELEPNYDARLIEICGQYVCTTGHVTKVWDLMSGELMLTLAHGENQLKVTSLAFKPGVTAIEEGSRLWLGTNFGDIQELDIISQCIVSAKSGAHERREVIRIYRHQNTMWTLDDGGKLCVWEADESGLPSLQSNPLAHRVPKGHTCSLVIQDMLWLATGKEIRVFRPGTDGDSNFSILRDALCQPNVGVVTCGTVVGGQMDRVYFGHADGKISIYSIVDFSCVGVVNVSIYKISTLVGAGFYLWAGYSTGMIYVYDTQTRPWIIKKDWSAHHGSPVLGLVVDRSSLWKTGVLRLTSVGSDNAIRFWDGTLESDWLEDEMQDRDIEYCNFRETTAMVMTWNAGAATPTHLRYEERDSRFFHELLQANSPPDLLVFGFQELVDLEDKKLTAKTLFRGNRKRDPTEPDHMAHQYRAWRDYLVRCVEDSMPPTEPYHLLHTASMVGLFSCVFIKASQRKSVRNVSAGEIKRGMGGLHGNKGALVIRVVLDDSSVCLVNCHLAAGQTKTVDRNNDITAILDSAVLPPERNTTTRSDTYFAGGDGSMILDNEICVINGDLNYRIDTMGRDTVVKAVNANNLAKLLERDQLLVSRRRSPVFRVRAFKESPITFAPTYKYDVGSDRYDTSEKRRAPAWCDRILYRGPGKIRQVDYRRHELRVSDHRPVTGLFKMRIKTVLVDKRSQVRRVCEERLEAVRSKLAKEAKIQYLRDVLGVPANEAQGLI